MYKKCVIIPINRSDLAYESSISAIFRSYELVNPDAFFILYSNFNKPTLNKIEEIVSNTLKIEKVQLHTEGKEEIEKIKDQCEKIYLVPSSGANITAMIMGQLEYPKISYIFSFGPWYNYFYPFVPRLVEDYKIYGQAEVQETNALVNIKENLLKKIDELAKGNQFLKEMYKLSLELNSKDSLKTTFDIRITSEENGPMNLSDSYFNSTNTPLDKRVSLNEKLFEILCKEYYHEKECRLKNITNSEKIKRLEYLPNNILKLIGLYPIVVQEDESQKELNEIVEGADLVLVDTNLIYNGIHTYEIKGLAIPQCAIYEIENKWFQEKDHKQGEFYDVLYEILKGLLRKTKIIPTITELCDIAVPKIDPTLLDKAIILTGDKKAYKNWKYLPLSKYTQIKYAAPDYSRIRNEQHYRAYFELSLAIILKRLLKEDKIEVCYAGKTDKCVEVEND
ncbi:hypothetical protein [Acidianus manzaensis]|uniref:Uncharacterized protein n=1 Tax=Acidianus manzaensis TaxID=282676 RepID=A0A1W6JWI7_9CREN|nr:hypothetical protein [Acidianus manzaensis]ARM74602.1 hypothetical protein B6F84_00200 [Acidianus manzaensis]